MRKALMVSVLLILASMTLSVECPPPSLAVPNFPYEVSKCIYRVIGSIQVNEGTSLSVPVKACDPDGDLMVFTLSNSPVGMILDPNEKDPNWATLRWPSPKAGIYYPNVKVQDIPMDGKSLSDNGTVVIRVWRGNKPPVITGCGK